MNQSLQERLKALGIEESVLETLKSYGIKITIGKGREQLNVRHLETGMFKFVNGTPESMSRLWSILNANGITLDMIREFIRTKRKRRSPTENAVIEEDSEEEFLEDSEEEFLEDSEEEFEDEESEV